ncbi:MAG: CYTH domain-containing protein [Xanthomonadales bacterium]|nr:CYTH domain-containing protein [Xanthomonadales bacterium]
MPIEIERKYLVSGDSWRELAHESKRLRQGYLGGENCSIRVRIKGDEARLNIKSRELGTTRLEYEYPIPLDEAEEILERLTTGSLIEKTRHLVEHDGLVWEVDEFEGNNAGLMVAEVELEADDQQFDKPAWAGTEVTDDERYYNARLAREPYRDWSDR